MTTREYFHKLRAESFAEDRELCLDCWQIAQDIGDSHNFPRFGSSAIDTFTFHGCLVIDSVAIAQWEALPQRAQNRYVDLLRKIEHTAFVNQRLASGPVW